MIIANRKISQSKGLKGGQMQKERELWLRWDEPDMYLEIYKENLFIEECTEKKSKMSCVWSADKSVYPLDFILTVKDNTAICDFEKLDYSHDIEVEIGIMCGVGSGHHNNL